MIETDKELVKAQLLVSQKNKEANLLKKPKKIQDRDDDSIIDDIRYHENKRQQLSRKKDKKMNFEAKINKILNRKSNSPPNQHNPNTQQIPESVNNNSEKPRETR